MAIRDNLKFLIEFARRPRNTGAIAPSSRYLAREIIAEIGLEEASLVVEYGPGSGAFTGEIVRRMPDDADFIALENNPEMIGMLRRAHPAVSVVHESIARATDVLREHGWEPPAVDAIVSGLPWAAFGESLQDRLLNVTESVLSPRGRFATFAYIHGLLLPAGRRFRGKLNQHFGEVSRSPVVWRNLPPAFVYRCSGRN
jgi:phospholipid N-methyltransferase